MLGSHVPVSELKNVPSGQVGVQALATAWNEKSLSPPASHCTSAAQIVFGPVEVVPGAGQPQFVTSPFRFEVCVALTSPLVAPMY